jgi:hypothetical protein
MYVLEEDRWEDRVRLRKAGKDSKVGTVKWEGGSSKVGEAGKAQLEEDRRGHSKDPSAVPVVARVCPGARPYVSIEGVYVCVQKE